MVRGNIYSVHIALIQFLSPSSPCISDKPHNNFAQCEEMRSWAEVEGYDQFRIYQNDKLLLTCPRYNNMIVIITVTFLPQSLVVVPLLVTMVLVRMVGALLLMKMALYHGAFVMIPVLCMAIPMYLQFSCRQH